MRVGQLQQLSIVIWLLLITLNVSAQMAGRPTGHCHVIDGAFTACPDGSTEWSDVKPMSFPATKSYLYVNQDAGHTFLYLMYDFPFRTAPLAAGESVHVSFDTVSRDSGTPGLEVYDILIFGDGRMQILENGQPTPAGRISGAAGFGTSPGSSTPHLRAELEVPLTPGPPTNYSPDPLYWSASLPPTPTPPPPPPSCPVTVLGVCVKSQEQIDAWSQEAVAEVTKADDLYANGLKTCDSLGQQAQLVADAAAQQALSDAAGVLDFDLNAVAAAQTNIKSILDNAALVAKLAPAVGIALVQASNALANLAALAPIASPTLYVDFNLAAFSASAEVAAAALTTAEAVAAAAGAVPEIVLAVGAGVAAVNVAVAAEVLLAKAIQAVAQAAATDACLAALDVVTSPYYAKAAYYELLAEDPPDPNFTVIATPVVPTLPGQPITTATGFSQPVVADLNALIVNAEQEISLLRVIPTSINRVSGAVEAGSQFWQQRQAQAVQQYASQLSALESNESSLRTALASDLTTSGLVSTFTSNDVIRLLGPVSQSGLPSGVTTALGQLGVDATTQSKILDLATSASPDAVAALGSGAFPQALVDPTFTSAANTAITALNTLASVPPANSLSPSLNIAIPGDYTSAGVGLRGQTGGNITITGVPSGATIVKALLYWGMLDNGEDASLRQMNFNGTPISGTRIGTGPDTCWGRTNSFSYRNDVTSLFSANGTYVLSGVANGGNILAEGASLVVIYQVPGSQTKTVMLSDGNVSISTSGVSLATSSFSGFSATSPVAAAATFIVGDGQGQFGASSVTFSGNLGTLNIPGLFTSKDGLYWDTDSFNVSSVIGAGNTSNIATIRLTGDCLLWTAQAFSITTTPNTVQPVIATSAVVQANPDGSTVVEARGLGPNDAPTLEQQIQMIVQSEIIQNPTLVARQLTTQLISSLPANILPPDQATSLVNTVVSSVITPAPVPTPVNLVITKTLTRSGNTISAQLKITNTGGSNAFNVMLSALNIGGVSASLVPQNIGTIAAGASTQFTVTVPGSVGGPGVSSSLTAKGTYLGGQFSVSSRISLP